MRKLLLTTAILGSMAAPALAQDQPLFREAPEATEVRASDFLGMRVYASEAGFEGDEFEGIQEGWEDIGEVEDVVLNRDGAVQAVLVDIGGFLGIGERTVAVSMDALQFVSDSATAEEADDFFLVINASREQLENAPEYGGAEQGEGMTAEEAATETEEAIEGGGEGAAAAGAAAGAAVGAAVEGVEDAGEETAEATEDAATTVVITTEDAGEEVGATAENAAEGVENAVEETGEEVADAGAEVADEAADAGEEVAEEVDQADMTDTQEDQDGVADESADAQEEAAEAGTEATDEVDAAPTGATEGDVMGDVEVGEAADVAATGAAEGDPADEIAEETTAETEETAEAAATETTTEEAPARTPIEREGFVGAGAEELTADRLEGAAVFDTNDERVGEVGEIILSAEGQVEQLVVDVGGFLGLGEKPVALDMATLDILRQDEGEEIRVYVSQTKEELEAMERYEAE